MRIVPVDRVITTWRAFDSKHYNVVTWDI